MKTLLECAKENGASLEKNRIWRDGNEDITAIIFDNEVQLQATFDDYCKQFEPACVIKTLKDDHGFKYGVFNNETNVGMPQGTELYTKPQPAQIQSEVKKQNEELEALKQDIAIYHKQAIEDADELLKMQAEHTQLKAYIERLESALQVCIPLARYGLAGTKDIEQKAFQDAIHITLASKPNCLKG